MGEDNPRNVESMLDPRVGLCECLVQPVFNAQFSSKSIFSYGSSVRKHHAKRLVRFIVSEHVKFCENIIIMSNQIEQCSPFRG